MAAHVQTPADFHAAIAGGVDLIAHLPGYEFDRDEDPTAYWLSAADAALATRRHIAITPTASLAASAADTDTAWLHRMQGVERRNMALLRRAGIGSMR